jgi:hypothetical protein
VILPVVQLLVALSGPPAGAATARPSPEVALHDAIKLFDAFQDDKAAAALRVLLKHSPPSQIASKAHLYLGLIAFNRFDPDVAKAEFRHALEINPANDLPLEASPKARTAFAEARRDFDADLAKGVAPPSPPPEAAPPAATAAPIAPVAASAAVEPQQPSRSHVAAYVLGAVTLVLAGVAVYGGIEVLNYNSTVSAANSAPPGSKPTYSADAHGPASFWAVGWPVAAGLGAAGVAGTVLTW